MELQISLPDFFTFQSIPGPDTVFPVFSEWVAAMFQLKWPASEVPLLICPEPYKKGMSPIQYRTHSI